MYASVIYKITSPSGKSYIGSAKNFKKRCYEHIWYLEKGKHHSRVLQRAWNKYGNVFVFTILIICREEDLFFYEQRALDILKPEYNISLNAIGTRGLIWTEESKAKLKNRKYPPEYGKFISERVMLLTTPESRKERARKAQACWTEESEKQRREKLIGRKLSIETRALMSSQRVGHPTSEATKEKIRAQRGWKHSEESKLKMRGRVRTKEHRQKLSLAHMGQQSALGHKLSDETKAIISAKLKGRKRSPEAIAKHRQTNAMKRGDT